MSQYMTSNAVCSGERFVVIHLLHEALMGPESRGHRTRRIGVVDTEIITSECIAMIGTKLGCNVVSVSKTSKGSLLKFPT